MFNIKYTFNCFVNKCGTRCLSHVKNLSIVQDINLKEIPLVNEPILSYKKNSRERDDLIETLKHKSTECQDIPIVIGDEEIRTDNIKYQVMPHDHSKKIAKYYHASTDIIKKAIDNSVKSQRTWDAVPLDKRIDIWMRAADLMATKYRQELNSATILGQSKTAIQAEIDSAAELVDFFRFNAYFLQESLKYRPISPKESINSMRHRGHDGFIAAISPFNFTAIGGNLAYTPALMGNSVLWKPSDTAILSGWTIFKICREAGVPAGVVNFIPAAGPDFGDTITQSPYLSGINFTGSPATFNHLWSQVGANIQTYINYPKLSGECGGKNYHFVHPSANTEHVVLSTIRSAFEYSGQKCSACSRMYVPESLWPTIRDRLVSVTEELKLGPADDFTVFSSAVIDAAAFKRITSYINYAKTSPNNRIIAGGTYDDSVGYFVRPTVIVTTDPMDKLMQEEIFGPVLTIYVYQDRDLDSAMNLVEKTTPYALTGSIFTQDREWAVAALEQFKYTAGNFYVNDKSTGAVVGQQPFGGHRKSGTNDKSGGPVYVHRWSSPQTIKETFVTLNNYKYEYMH
ncbi:delta-1-pyrroline-5-carboxylate dehydrogenase, mitochondrial [Microplitis mediator]|uniref:delta-1-pyrroline-5-carboxylate dehydrogenase, mitochondrial n=1 Tax=Microplitis mediator TaxID=375433 RepID=UPI002557A80C|nr:delta-1-pyrroline-5-carboxylate dehydrogenase, mitochondrial [Microplitis mediator]